MGKLLFLILSIIKNFRKLKLRLTGNTEFGISSSRVVSGKAWDDFCDQLKLAGASLHYPGAPTDPFQQAEGIRYLTRLTRAGLEAFVEYNDPAFPVLRQMVHETVKMGADNPDNVYLNAQISGHYEYRITGKRNTIDYIGFFTQNGNYGSTGGLAPCGKIDDKQLVCEPDGSFEIILSKTPKGKNWLKIENETGLVIIRQTYLDRKTEIPAELRIENLDGRKAPDPVTPEKIDEGLKTAAMFVGGASLLFSRWANNFRKHSNRLPMFDPAVSNAAGGDESIIYYHSHWKLGPEEALVIEVLPPSCDTWNFQLNNYWMESLDYRYFNICLNKASAKYEEDGSVRLIVSPTDPGHPNWIDTCGHTEGTMCWRWYRLKEGVQPVAPGCQVVQFKDLKDHEKR
ncbi:MAG TPA: DUF1214 domain-containing protein [Bacteroidales bacterium]|nr:DUF1214 domain-containing protein [Bacteroidales bacterium]HOX76562.1 DUF1214 domain-containing protein [Bacteroidales bacterium]HPI85226.1 DUF1214 domain-containing protein [Bacteroidales bacterium]HPM92658.1 DUF1214 domain-containing protein [Bacteroidales bacterium]